MIARAKALPLWLKLAVAIVGIVAAALGAMAWTSLALLEGQLTETTLERSNLFLNRLERDFLASIRDGPGAGHLFEPDRNTSHEVLAVRVLSPGGVVLKTGSADELGRRFDLSRDVAVPSGLTWSILAPRGGPKTIRVTRPLRNEPRCSPCHDSQKGIVGFLSLDASFDHQDRLIASSSRVLGSAAVATVILTSLALWGFMWFEVNRPLSNLARAMARVDRGDLTVRAAVSRGDEVGRLTQRFNNLIATLEHAQLAMEEGHRSQLMRAGQLAAIGELASSIAHEVKNPLAGIGSAMQVLLRGSPEADPRREVFEEILGEIRRLQHVVRDLLEFAKPAPSLPVLSDVNRVVERALVLLRPVAQEQGTLLVEKLATDLPILLLDAKHMQQVFLNIGMNALQAVETGGEVTVLTTLDETGRWVEVTIRDTGPGISVQDPEAIFEPFFTTKPKGTGLGLAIARQIVTRHGGEVVVESRPGEGATFAVRLPVRSAS